MLNKYTICKCECGCKKEIPIYNITGLCLFCFRNHRNMNKCIKCEKCKRIVEIEGHKIYDWVICPYCHWWNEL